jgi:hypothetical protein
MKEEGKGRELPVHGESDGIMIPYAQGFADAALGEISRLVDPAQRDVLDDDERRDLLRILVQYVMVNGGFPEAIRVLTFQPAEHLVWALLELTRVQPGLFRGEGRDFEELADCFVDLAELSIDEEWNGEDLHEPEDFVTMSRRAGPYHGDLLRDLLKVLRSLPRERPSLYWSVIDKLGALNPPNFILATLILSDFEPVLESVRRNAAQAWAMLVEAGLFLDDREWRQLAFQLAPTLGQSLLSTDGDCYGLWFPCEFLRADACREDLRGVCDICRVLGQICRTEAEAEAAWTALGMSAEELFAIFIGAEFGAREHIAAFWHAAAAFGAGLPLPAEVCVEEVAVDDEAEVAGDEGGVAPC